MRLGACLKMMFCSGLVVLGTADEGGAQLYRFGKNKVQFTDFDWQKMETPNFDVYFYAEEEELAGYAAHMAEVSAHLTSHKAPKRPPGDRRARRVFGRGRRPAAAPRLAALPPAMMFSAAAG